ncbi:MAG TPA: efflux RND transporter periplasmic adaptor subunit [Phycisphaerae bacterium]|nr:efflux RND transporter periplasmic adaptor subunit [Phycisphaerae bacterium]
MTLESREESQRRERQAPGESTSGSWRRVLRAVAMYLLPVVVIVGGGLGAVRLYQTGPKARQRPPQARDTLVQVATVSRTNANATVHVMGTVVAAQEVVLQPRVSGEIIKLSPEFVPGGRFEAGEFVLQIDSKDYELTVEKTRSQVAQAQYEVKMEQGAQEIAQREWELLGVEETATEQDRELALRKPHLIKAKAALEAANAAVREAKLALERTTIVAPFNAIVTTESVDVGAQVTQQTQLGTLVGTDEYWVRAAVPVDQLGWIQFPDAGGEAGSTATIRQQLATDLHNEWTGRVARLMGDLEPEGRMARVLIAVQDPLRLAASGDGGLPLLIGSYVSVVIEGRQVEDVIALPRTALRDGDSVWIMNDQNKLEIHSADIVWRSRDTVWVRDGIEPGQRLVVSDLPAPVEGMGLTLGTDSTEDTPENGLAYQADEDTDHADTK